MTKKGKKKAAVHKQKGESIEDQIIGGILSDGSSEGQRTPDSQNNGKKGDLMMTFEAMEALQNLNSWLPGGSSELPDGINKDLALGLWHSLKLIDRQNKDISDLTNQLNSIRSEFEEEKQKWQQENVQNKEVVAGLQEFEHRHHQETFNRQSKIVAPNIVIKNVTYKENELPQKTHDLVAEIIKKLRAPSGTLTFVKATRILNTKKEAKDGQKEFHPLVRVTLGSPQMKKELFSRLSNLKEDKKFSKISIQNEIPPCVRRQAMQLEIEAATYRKENPGMKTKIDFSNGYPKIMIKDLTKPSKYKDLHN